MKVPTIVFPEPRRVAIEEWELAEPGPGQVLVRTTASVISTGTELTALTGDFPPGRSAWARYVRYPFPAGYSMAGEVVALGPGVEAVQVGDHVCGAGRHATHSVLNARGLRRIPAGIADEAAAFRTMAEITLNGVRLSQMIFGEALAIVGMGLVGQLAAQWARFAGALPLIGLDLSARRLDLAAQIGPLVRIQPGQEDQVEAVRAATRGRMADAVIEATGDPNVLPGAVKLARRNGRVVLLGSPRGATTIDMHEEVHTLGLHLIGAHNGTHPRVETPGNPWTGDRDGELFLDLLAGGHAHIQELITHRYAWQQAPDAYAVLLADRTQALGVVLEWG